MEFGLVVGGGVASQGWVEGMAFVIQHHITRRFPLLYYMFAALVLVGSTKFYSHQSDKKYTSIRYKVEYEDPGS